MLNNFEQNEIICRYDFDIVYKKVYHKHVLSFNPALEDAWLNEPAE